MRLDGVVTPDLAAVLAFGILSLVFVAYEIIGLTMSGTHTISYLAHHYYPLRLTILLFFSLMPVWWWIHSARDIPR